MGVLTALQSEHEFESNKPPFYTPHSHYSDGSTTDSSSATMKSSSSPPCSRWTPTTSSATTTTFSASASPTLSHEQLMAPPLPAAMMTVSSSSSSSSMSTFPPHPLASSSDGGASDDLDPRGFSEPPLCAGCRLRIVDKYFLCAIEQKWHASCLKCAECGVELEGQNSCYEKNGHIFCKDDYIRIYGHQRRCSRCHLDIQSSDLVMKARHCLYHLECFRCAVCDDILRKGDLFGMLEDSLYCKTHFYEGGHKDQPGVFFQDPPASPTYHHPHQHQPPPHPPPPQHPLIPPPMHHPHGIFTGPGGDPWYPGGGGEFPQPPLPPVSTEAGGGLPPSGGHHSHHLHHPGVDEYPFENNNEPLLKKKRGRKKRKAETFAAAMNGFLDGGGSYPPGGLPPGMDPSGCPQGKTKRARTSFKHHQLRIMKSHFQINQNPDSRELKMLSQKTGLDKKVLQVWFQNARAKWRRVNAQNTNNGSSSSGPGGSGSSGANAGMNPHDNHLSSMMAMAEDNCDSDSMHA